MQNKISFYIILVVEILTVVLASVGVLEKEAVLIMTGLLIFYFIFSKVEDSLILFIISIPLFIALPIGNFDSMANWRILLAVLFLCLFFKQGISIEIIKDKLGRLRLKEKFKHYSMEYLMALFLGIGVLSLFVATDIVVGIKKILFLVNIFLLYMIIRNVIARNKEMLPRIIKAGAAAGIISLIVGYSQLISIFFKPLYTFWQWWAKNVISIFYGSGLSELLAVSNTWFSYYENSPPTLRMFSIFPDSHSFALFMIISLIFFSYLLFRKNRIYWVVIILSLLALIFSGSRGIWVSAAIPFLGIILLLFFKNIRKYIRGSAFNIKPFVGMLVIFLLAFPTSSLILSQSYQDGGDGTLAFKRIKSITDLEELSVKNRIGIWKTSFKSILKHPLLGVGIGNYPVVLDEDISAAKKGASAHNLYLDIASEMGLLGLIVLLLIFWQIFKRGWKTNLIFTFFLLWIFIYSLFDVVLLNDKVLLLFMVVLGVLYSIKNHDE